MQKKNIKYLILLILAVGALAGMANGVLAQTFSNPIGYTTVNGVLSHILTTVQAVVATLAVLMIVVGGIIYITSAGDQGRVELAKKAVWSAIIGLILTVAAPSFLREIYTALGSNEEAPASKSLSDIIFSVLQTLIGLIGTLAVLMLVVGGIMYMTSGGDQTKSETAVNTIKFAIIGLVVAIISYIIVTEIIGLF